MTVTDELRDVVRSYLADRPGASWGMFAGELGVAGLAVPEEYGGAGCGPAEVAAVAEELGRALSPHPFLQTAVLAVEAVKAGGDAAAMARLLPVLAGGGRSATVALPGDGELVLEDGLLSGVVPYAPAGELVLVYAAGLLMEAEPMRRAPHRTVDESRPLEELTFERVPVRPAGDGSGWTRVRDLGVAALAAEQTGGAARCLEMATDHARSRHQFGRPIGSFQAVKHKLADLLLLVESARSAALGAAGAGEADLEEAAAIAGSYCSEAYLTAAGENIQIHGGIGVTWEHPAHRYFKRATSDAQLFGPPQAHRARLAARVLG
ncbi:acyl-CoA dehydrogenase family protein [Nonomuraea roseoviolacea]|uniref:Alkylation response protein AidB-like acyl-CoA dehydrogenase n=1 Tax=Nonomuraea roseoviolacea subsp. carminata TaxID=160689 RepID=A0ABT1JTC2_9ACTN|nr:acyl-CoA dehydrogenase family protein [Nonomuraea roseoviolacea]MCP2344987.1 alkylation response protein AidB-like acyl-CoA dehydrogenase [Nonomuraea roseoviolacea subsp. carminata]